MFGNSVEISLRKGQWKVRSNDSRRTDGHVPERRPPKQVEIESGRSLGIHEGHAALSRAPILVEESLQLLPHEPVRLSNGVPPVKRLLQWAGIRHLDRIA